MKTNNITPWLQIAGGVAVVLLVAPLLMAVASVAAPLAGLLAVGWLVSAGSRGRS
jgi:hypothetical protein